SLSSGISVIASEPSNRSLALRPVPFELARLQVQVAARRECAPQRLAALPHLAHALSRREQPLRGVPPHPAHARDVKGDGVAYRRSGEFLARDQVAVSLAHLLADQVGEF